MQTSTAIEKYAIYMEEIKSRIVVIDRAISSYERGGSLTGFVESDIELIFLQFRHCLELIMLASLVAHHHQGIALSKKFYDKEFNATKLLAYMKSVNKGFYPKPMTDLPEKNEKGQFQAVDSDRDYLKIDDFKELYDRVCGKMLHAQRSSKFFNMKDELIKQSTVYRNKIVALLECHWIHFDDKSIIRTIMNEKETGRVAVNILDYVGPS